MDERHQSKPWTRIASWEAGRLLTPACRYINSATRARSTFAQIAVEDTAVD
jgi:hypothetical protein